LCERRLCETAIEGFLCLISMHYVVVSGSEGMAFELVTGNTQPFITRRFSGEVMVPAFDAVVDLFGISAGDCSSSVPILVKLMGRRVPGGRNPSSKVL